MKDLRISKIANEDIILEKTFDKNHEISNKTKELPTKQGIMLYLKKHGQTDLKTLSSELKLSKMGILKHITALEELGYIERETKKAPKGRPKVYFILSDSTRDHVFPNNYSDLTNYFLNYIEENYGISAVEKALKDRNKEVSQRYRSEIKGQTLQERVACLRTLRDNEGYMAEQLKSVSDNSFELLEFNCPIFKIAEQYSYTCTLEREMFEELLDASVNTTHKVIDGQNVCRFLITKKIQSG